MKSEIREILQEIKPLISEYKHNRNKLKEKISICQLYLMLEKKENKMSDQGTKESQSVIFQGLDELRELNESFENVNSQLNEKAEWILSKNPVEAGNEKERESGDCKLSGSLIEICNHYDKNIKTLRSLIEQICL